MGEFESVLREAEVFLSVLIGIAFRNERGFSEEEAETAGRFEFMLQRIVGIDGEKC